MDKQISRQREYQLRKIKQGLCSKCGHEPITDYKEECNSCVIRKREYSRKYHKCKPWKIGSRGRKPIVPDKE